MGTEMEVYNNIYIFHLVNKHQISSNKNLDTWETSQKTGICEYYLVLFIKKRPADSTLQKGDIKHDSSSEDTKEKKLNNFICEFSRNGCGSLEMPRTTLKPQGRI